MNIAATGEKKVPNIIHATAEMEKQKQKTKTKSWKTKNKTKLHKKNM